MLEYRVVCESNKDEFQKQINKASKDGYTLGSQYSMNGVFHYVLMARKKAESKNNTPVK